MILVPLLKSGNSRFHYVQIMFRRFSKQGYHYQVFERQGFRNEDHIVAAIRTESISSTPQDIIAKSSIKTPELLGIAYQAFMIMRV